MMRFVVATLGFLGAALPVWAEIEIVPVTSPAGITAWLYEEHSIPIMTIEASFRGGSALDPDGQEGVASLMAGLLEEGAADLDATDFAEARETLAARFDFSAYRDSIGVSAEMLTENRDLSLAWAWPPPPNSARISPIGTSLRRERPTRISRSPILITRIIASRLSISLILCANVATSPTKSGQLAWAMLMSMPLIFRTCRD
jgi:hypothetical protein